MIGSVSFAWVAQKKNHEVFAISMKDIEKVLNLKKSTDPATVLSKEYHEFLDVFSRQLADTLSPHQPHDHHICLELRSQLIFKSLYGMSRDELLVLKKYLDDNLTKEFIQASFFSAASSVLFVHKPEDGLWFCVDYRGLNAIMIKNCYLLPLIRETLNWMSKTQYFTKLDVVTAFNKLWMIKRDEWLTVFHTHYGLYKYLVMLFELFNAPASFQNYINDILQDYLDVFCTTYIDNILIYSDTLKEHRQHVQQILQKLQRAGLQLDIDKCEFHVQEVKYLELIIGVDGIKMDPVKVEAIQTWPTPINEQDVWDFLGFTNFYWWFIKRFSRLVWPLTQLTKKDTPFQWKSDCEAVFQQLKKTFTEALILQHFDWTHEVTVETDTSDTVVAGVLLQKNENSQLQPVTYFSSKMSLAEVNYDIYDKKLLAIIWVFKEWCSELEGSEEPVQVLCNHKNLEWFMTTKSLSWWQTHWSEFLSQFNFKIIYRPGCFNIWVNTLTHWSGDLPKKGEDDLWRSHQKQILLKFINIDDHLIAAQNQSFKTHRSRPVSLWDFYCSVHINANNLSPEPESEPEPKPRIMTNNTEDEETPLNLTISEAYWQDDFTKNTITKLREGAWTQKGFSLVKCSETDDQIWYWDHLYLPEIGDICLCVIHEAHNPSVTGHLSWHKTYDLVVCHYWWPRMVKMVWWFVCNCHACLWNKTSQDKYHDLLKLLAVPERQWAHIFMNFIIELFSSKVTDDNVYQNVLVVVDHLTKMRHLIFCQSMTKEKMVHLFHQHVWKYHELPSTIISDCGTQFVTHFWDELCQCLGIKSTLFTAYHSEINEQIKNVNAVLKQYLQAYVAYLQDDWVDWLPSAEFAANNQFSETTQHSPFFANYEQHPHMRLKPKEAWEAPRGSVAWMDHENADRFAEKMNQINEDLQQQMHLAQAIYEDFVNCWWCSAPTYQMGDAVWLNTWNLPLKGRPSRKLAVKYQGPYKILKVVSSHAYCLAISDNFGIHDVFHTNLLRSAADDSLSNQILPVPFLCVNTTDLEEYEMEAVWDSKVTQNSTHLLVKWVGYDNFTWESMEAMDTATDAINIFYSHYSNKSGQVSWEAHHN